MYYLWHCTCVPTCRACIHSYLQNLLGMTWLQRNHGVNMVITASLVLSPWMMFLTATTSLVSCLKLPLWLWRIFEKKRKEITISSSRPYSPNGIQGRVIQSHSLGEIWFSAWRKQAWSNAWSTSLNIMFSVGFAFDPVRKIIIMTCTNDIAYQVWNLQHFMVLFHRCCFLTLNHLFFQSFWGWLLLYPNH